jgi:hypothetical protein
MGPGERRARAASPGEGTRARSVESRGPCRPTRLEEERIRGMKEGGLTPEKVHAQQSFSFPDRFLGPHGFIANADAMFIGAHLSPPQPRRAAQNHSMSLRYLFHLNIGALQVEEKGKAHSERAETPLCW